MAVTAHENMNMIAVGYKDSSVVLIRGNITRDRMSRQKLVHQEETAGVHITGHISSLSLYCCTSLSPPSSSPLPSFPFSLPPLPPLLPFSSHHKIFSSFILLSSLSLSRLHHFSLSLSHSSLPSLPVLSPDPSSFLSLQFLGLGFRQVGQVTYLMVATTAAVYAILATDSDKEVRGREGGGVGCREGEEEGGKEEE